LYSKKFIKATENYCKYDAPVNAPYIRKTFKIDNLPETASITLTCTGFYRLWVNGTEITYGHLAPCISNPDEMLFYDTYDVKKLLIHGKNCIALLLGNGISNAIGGYIWDFDKALFRSAPKLALCFEGVNGENVFSFEADTSFKCTASPILFDDLRSGEHYDANLEIKDWNLSSFDDSKWNNAIVVDTPRGKTVANETDRIQVTKELKAVKIYEGIIPAHEFPEKTRKDTQKLSETAFYQPESKESGYIYEFSENPAFIPKLKIKGRKGQRIAIQCAEYCSPNNEMSYENTSRFYPEGFCQRDVYICRGEGTEEYIPSFTYHSARYIMIIGADKEQITDDLITMLVMNSDLPERGTFSCSDPIANRLQKNARTSDLANFVYFPTDCPHREKNGWTGDAAISAEHMMQNLGIEKSLKQWLKMICAAQREDGAIPGIIPTSGWGYAWGNGPVWDNVIIELPYQNYIYRGDIEMFSDCADAVMKYLNYISKRRNGRGLIEIGLGDWCQVLRSSAGNHTCPLVVSDTVTTYSICRKAEFMFGVIGQKAQQAFAKALAEEFYISIRKYLIDFNTMTVMGKCQGAQAIGLYYGIFETGERPAAYNRLVEFVHHADDHMDCGMIGLRTMFRLLGEGGDAELAYKMITRTDAPSYGMWVENYDLVSMAESFEREVNGHRTSLNHHFMSDISGFFISHIAGICINPYKNDASFVRVQPNFISTLDNAESYYDTIKGKVSVRWEREGETILLKTEKAEGVTGEIILPDGYEFVYTSNNIRHDWTVGRRVLDLESGEYGIRKI